MAKMNLFPKPHPQTAGRVIDGEAVLILSDASEVNVLNSVGSRIYELADGSRSVGEIIDSIVKEYDATPEQAEKDVAAFLQQLVEREVLIYSEERNS